MDVFKPSYKFKNTSDTSSVMLSPAEKDENGMPKPLPFISIGSARFFVPRSKREQDFLINHRLVKGGSIRAFKMNNVNPVADSTNASTPKQGLLEIVKSAVKEDGSLNTPASKQGDNTAGEAEMSSIDALIENNQEAIKKQLAESVTTIQKAVKVLREMGYEHNMRKRSEIEAFAKEKGFSFPNWN